MAISLSLFIIPYLFFLGIVALFGFFNLFHILRFGIKSNLGIASIAIYLVGVFFILVTTVAAASTVNWTEVVTIGLAG
jgi:hypothetical protein